MSGIDVAGIGALSDLVRTGLEKIWPDKAKVAEATNAIIQPLLEFMNKSIQAQVDVIVAEAKGESWLQRNWRPLVMMDFALLITAHWLGWTSPNITEAVLDHLLEIIKIGLGGYVIGRSAEKIAESIAPAIAARGK